MPTLYPLRLQPEFYQRVWGSRDLSPIYSQVAEGEPIGEAWLTGDNCRVANGSLAGSSLAELCRRFGRELVGEAAPQSDRFPLLLKFLFPREKLSVQVHPDDAQAHSLGLSCGKTECWYVLAAEPGASVALGLKPGTTKPEFEQAIRQTRAEALLNWIEVSPGDLIYVDAGTVHAIGPGLILLETQQNSDTTYRLYDYGRPRELHVDQGLAALKLQTHAGKVKRRLVPGAAGEVLVEAPCFRVGRTTQAFSSSAMTSHAATCIVALDGNGVVESDGSDPVAFTRGETVVVPAAVNGFRVRPQGAMDIVWARLPGESTGEPEVEALLAASQINNSMTR